MENTTPEKKANGKKEVAKRRCQHMAVWALPEQKTAIEANAKMAGLSVSKFLLKLGLGANIKPVIDPVVGRQILKNAGEIGKVGGLLKMLLTNSERFGGTRGEVLQIQTQELLNDINEARLSLVSAIKNLNK